ncbi:MAG: hypothetical protein K2X48_14455 [Chitinophagaceae bacterium]|nr:hypothetical protein [Chitinophagaceae bacterium]
MKHLFYFLLLIITVSSCGSSCNKDKDKYEEVLFEFTVPLNISPGIDTINVGQELTIIADFTDSLFDVLSQKKYYLPNFNFKTVAVIQKLTNPSLDILDQTSAVGKFSFSNIIGSFSNFSATFADVNYVYQNNRYLFTGKIIPNEKGVFIIRFYHNTGSKGSTELPQALAPNVPGIKRFPLMRNIRFVFNNGNTHFNIYKDNVKERDPNEATNWVESKATYTFIVK